MRTLLKKITLSLTLFSITFGTNTFVYGQLQDDSEMNQTDEVNYFEGELIVQVKENASMKAALAEYHKDYKFQMNRLLSQTMRAYLVTFDHTKISQDDAMELLSGNSKISLVQNNHKVTIRSTTPNDPQFNQQWHHLNTSQTGGTNDADIDTDEAWDVTTGGQTATGDDIVVCLIEGANMTHPDLIDNRWVNPNEIPNNGTDDDGNGYTDDIYGWDVGSNSGNVAGGNHGTSCAGMIGAKGNNNTGVAGANWDVKIMVVSGYNVGTSSAAEASVISAYDYPLQNRKLYDQSGGSAGAFVVATSASWGIDGGDPNDVPLWCNFYDTLGTYGILNCGATTNQNLDVDASGDIPTACSSPYMIGVGRSDHNDGFAGGYGATTIDFAAPGINVRTTSGTTGYTTTTGTSFACPLTAGAIALLYSAPCAGFMSIVQNDPQQGADIIRSALHNGVDVKPAMTGNFVTDGRLNVNNSLNIILNNYCSGTLCLAPGGVTTGTINDNDVTITWNSSANASSYNLYYKETSAGTWNNVNTSNTSYTITGLSGCTEYEYYLESDCSGDISTPSNTTTFTTTGCGNCIDLSYCTSNATDANDEWIETFEIDTYVNNSGNDNGYGDFTGPASVTLQQGNTYNVDITPGFGGQAWNENYRVWIDFNQDGTFDPGELVYDSGAAVTGAVNGTISVPVSASIGSTRLRVIQNYIGGSSTQEPVCGSYTYGETEDYCIEITSNSSCGFTTTDNIIHTTCDAAANGSIELTVTGAATPINYSWAHDASNNTNMASGLTSGSYDVTITDDNGCDETYTYVVNEAGADFDYNIITTDASCNGDSDGSAEVIINSAVTPVTYSWSHDGGLTGNVATGLSQGNYNVTLTDAEGCEETASYTIGEPGPVTASFTSIANDLTVDFTNTSSPGSYSWDFDDGNNSTDTNPTHTYAQDGTYNVCLEVTSNCGTDTDCQEIIVERDVSSIDEEEEEFSIEAFPNPAQHVINFKVNHPDAQKITLYFISGQIVQQIDISNDALEMNVTNLRSGTYFYSVTDQEENVIKTERIQIIK